MRRISIVAKNSLKCDGVGRSALCRSSGSGIPVKCPGDRPVSARNEGRGRRAARPVSPSGWRMRQKSRPPRPASPAACTRTRSNRASAVTEASPTAVARSVRRRLPSATNPAPAVTSFLKWRMVPDLPGWIDPRQLRAMGQPVEPAHDWRWRNQPSWHCRSKSITVFSWGRWKR